MIYMGLVTINYKKNVRIQFVIIKNCHKLNKKSKQRRRKRFGRGRFHHRNQICTRKILGKGVVVGHGSCC